MEKVPFLNYREVLVRRACRVTPGDVTNREFVENAAQSTEAIVHLAGIIREFPARGVTFERVHGEATQHAVHAAKMWGISRFVHVSALGASPHGPGNYFSSKGKAEEIVRQSGLSWTIFRPSGIVGPGDQFLTELGRAVRRAPFLPIPGDGEFLLQPVFVGDVVKGITDCLKRPDTEKREFEVGGPERITYNALIDFSRFEKFPLTPDMLEVLLAGNTCERDPFFSTFGIDPLPLSVSLESMRATRTSEGEGTQAEGTDIGPGKREKGSSSRKAA
jgi:NADH dehydrogenase